MADARTETPPPPPRQAIEAALTQNRSTVRDVIFEFSSPTRSGHDQLSPRAWGALRAAAGRSASLQRLLLRRWRVQREVALPGGGAVSPPGAAAAVAAAAVPAVNGQSCDGSAYAAGGSGGGVISSDSGGSGSGSVDSGPHCGGGRPLRVLIERLDSPEWRRGGA